jgi:hypothetical protein
MLLLNLILLVAFSFLIRSSVYNSLVPPFLFLFSSLIFFSSYPPFFFVIYHIPSSSQLIFPFTFISLLILFFFFLIFFIKFYSSIDCRCRDLNYFLLLSFVYITEDLGWEISPSYQIYCILTESATEFEPAIKEVLNMIGF